MNFLINCEDSSVSNAIHRSLELEIADVGCLNEPIHEVFDFIENPDVSNLEAHAEIAVCSS